MTQFTTTRTYDRDAVLKTNAGKELSTFIEYVNNSIDNLARIIRQGIDTNDNINCQLKDVTVVNGGEVEIDVKSIPKGVWVIKQSPVSTFPINSFAWDIVSNTRIKIKASFLNSPSVNQTFLVSVWVQYS